MPIRTKRWNDPIGPEDGYRLLVCRYRPRGVSKESEPWDAWCSALSPSVDLHADAYGKDSRTRIEWSEYERRFLAEMERQRFWLDGFAARLAKGEMITLLCSSACVDPARCHRTIVERLLEQAAFPAPPQRTLAMPVRRKSP